MALTLISSYPVRTVAGERTFFLYDADLTSVADTLLTSGSAAEHAFIERILLKSSVDTTIRILKDSTELIALPFGVSDGWEHVAASAAIAVNGGALRISASIAVSALVWVSLGGGR